MLRVRVQCAVCSVGDVQLREAKQEELSIARKAPLWKTIPDPKIITHLHSPKTFVHELGEGHIVS